MDFLYWLRQSCVSFWERAREFPHAFAHDVHQRGAARTANAPRSGNWRDAFVATSCRLLKRLACRDRSDFPLRALALSGRTQALPQSLRRKSVFNLMSKRTGVVHTMCTSLARPWMGYAPKKFAENKHHSIEINYKFSWGEGYISFFSPLNKR